MALNKTDAIEQLGGPNSISNQQALVKKIQGTKISKPIKRFIPGGQNLTEELNQGNLATAVFNWVRHCRHFTECTISLCKDPTARKIKTSKVLDFDTNTKNTEWEIRGKRWLAERIADVLMTDNLLAVNVTKEGISTIIDTEGTFNPESKDWMPYVELTPFRPPTF